MKASRVYRRRQSRAFAALLLYGVILCAVLALTTRALILPGV
jgi:hypothetical protein